MSRSRGREEGASATATATAVVMHSSSGHQVVAPLLWHAATLRVELDRGELTPFPSYKLKYDSIVLVYTLFDVVRLISGQRSSIACAELRTRLCSVRYHTLSAVQRSIDVIVNEFTTSTQHCRCSTASRLAVSHRRYSHNTRAVIVLPSLR